MSSIYIKNVNIINPFSEEPLEERHVLIENGRIKVLAYRGIFPLQRPYSNRW